MTINQGTVVSITIPNAQVAKYDPDSDQYFVHAASFYGGAWIDARNVTKPDEAEDPPRPEGWDRRAFDAVHDVLASTDLTGLSTQARAAALYSQGVRVEGSGR